ncbi:MAG: glycosyltransferase [Ktedonobacterales bacterium]|nr:glycosyltransferase [Ktedonobacterales bacterium]
MKLLFVTPYLPLATKPRPYRFIEHLSRSHEIHLVAFDPAPAPDDPPRADYLQLATCCASITRWPLPRWQRYWNVVTGLPSQRPARVGYYGLERYTHAVHELVERLNIDAIHVDRLRLADLCAALPVPKIIDATDCISAYLGQCGDQVPLHLKPAYAFERAKTVRFERGAASPYDRCLVTTERERHLLSATDYADRLRVIPNILDEALFDRARESEATRNGPPTILFVGNLSYLPNVDAIRYLVTQIWPRVRMVVQNARLVLAGSAPSPAVVRLARGAPDVLVTGFVPDLAEAMARATVLVAPMRIAVGFPNKIAEALALGKPVVATSAAARGLGACDGALAIADDAEAFAREIARLVRDPEARQQLGDNARAYARARLHPADAKAQLDTAYREVIGTLVGACPC